MIKKISQILVLCFCFLFICGCSTYFSLEEAENTKYSTNKNFVTENNLVTTESNSINQDSENDIERKAIAEENEAMNNNTFLSISPIILRKSLLENNNFLSDKSDGVNGESYIHLKNEADTINIYLGSDADEKVYSVSYTIKNNTPLDNIKLRKEILETLKTILESLKEYYKEQVLIDYINSAKIGTVTPNLEYSDQLIIYCAQEKDYFSIEIKANS